MSELKFICVQPNEKFFTWQVHLWLESLKNINKANKAVVLIYLKPNELKLDLWDEIEKLYPETEFYYIEDEDGIYKLFNIYIPVLRPYCLYKFFTKFPEKEKNIYFYCDCDILFTKEFNIDHLINDDINYLSNTNSYINSVYFDSKIKDVIPEKLEEYNKKDVLQELSLKIGINRKICVDNKEHSGGAQYLLKNTSASFWKKVMNDSILIRSYLLSINKEFFKSENEGFQSWCADMWAVLWNIWGFKQETKVVKELDFAWSVNPISVLKSNTILHNAGVVEEFDNDVHYFYKGKYRLQNNFKEDVHKILNNKNSKKYCTWFYTNELNKLINKYKLDYE